MSQSTSSQRIAKRVVELVAQRVPFVLATVVRAEMPTSARPGDAAIVLGDGSVDGFVGGQCAEESVKVAAIGVLGAGEPLLLRILPEGGEEFPDRPGATAVVNPCLSGGAIEVFLEPKLPAGRISIVGNTPIAEALVGLAGQLGYAADHSPDGPGDPAGALAVIVSSHGRYETEAIRAAIDAEVGYIGLVASRVRGAAVLDEMDLDSQARAAVRSPVGIDIGARTAAEVALSILAEVTDQVRRHALVASKAGAGPGEGCCGTPVEAIDPICGMTVLVGDQTPHLNHAGTDFWYCNIGCRNRHADDLAAGVK